MLDKNEIKKELLKSKIMAEFSHYVLGQLFYRISLVSGVYQFPIDVIEINDNVISLSNDLGTTSFNNTERGSMLNRWVDKAIEKGEFIKVG